MATLAECLSRSKELDAVSDTARLDTEVLLAKAIDKPRTFLYTWAEKDLTPGQQQLFDEWFQRRIDGEPIAYILGEKEFWSLALAVNSSALIPRPETELLVETLLELLPVEAQKVLDLGTGTGAIALALASERPRWKIMAVDNSVAAVNLAIENCRQCGFQNVQITRSDWYYNVGNQPFDAIVCNPPYIDAADGHLQRGDVRFEPDMALIAKENGLAELTTVISGANAHLTSAGWLLVEHGWDQGKSVRSTFLKEGFVEVETKQDLASRDRITVGQKPQQTI